MDVTHQLVHGSENKNVSEKARGKSTGEPQVRSGMPIFVPREERNARPRNNPPGRPAFPASLAYPGGPAQRPTPTTTPVASGVGASSKGATTDSEEEDQPPAGAVAKGEGEANAAAGHRSPPPGGAAGGNGGSAAPPAALENLPSVVATGKTVHPQHSCSGCKA